MSTSLPVKVKKEGSPDSGKVQTSRGEGLPARAREPTRTMSCPMTRRARRGGRDISDKIISG